MPAILRKCRPHLLVLFALLTVSISGWHDALRNGLADLRFGWDQRAASGQVAVVAIDAYSIERIGVWPWPRRLHAELLRQLQQAGVRDIAFDIDFSSPSDPQADQAFGEALRSLGGSVLQALLIRNGDLEGFSSNELDVMANVARYHRKSPPKKSHGEYIALTPADRQRVDLHLQGVRAGAHAQSGVQAQAGGLHVEAAAELRPARAPVAHRAQGAHAGAARGRPGQAHARVEAKGGVEAGRDALVAAVLI